MSVITFTQEGVLKNDDSALKLIRTVVWMTDDVSTAAQLSSCASVRVAFSFITTLYIHAVEKGVVHSHMFKSSARLHPACTLSPCEAVSDSL